MKVEIPDWSCLCGEQTHLAKFTELGECAESNCVWSGLGECGQDCDW